MKQLLTLTLLVCTFFAGRAQNMVQNGGFEVYTTCPNTFSQINRCVNWDQPTNGTSDYFNACANATVGVPTNFSGYQQAYQGNGYIGFYNYNNGGGYREYGRGVVTPLVIGETYQVTIHVARSNNQHFACDGFGVFFYQNGIGAPTNVTTALNVTPQIDYQSYGIISDTLNWTTLTDTFTADSAYTHVIVGNFRDDANTAATAIGPNTGYAYYYLDSIDVVAVAFTSTTAHTDVSCHGGNNGTASVTALNGQPPITYLWLPGNQTTASISGLTAGSYTCIIRDALQDTLRDTIVISEPPALTATTTQTNVTCNGGNDGIAGVTASGGVVPYTYLWTPTGGTNATATGLTAGNYTCTITDSNGCTLQKPFTILQASVLAANVSQVNILCNGASTGSATVSMQGGQAPFTYVWTPTGGNNATASNLAAGSYTCNITDAYGCTLTETFLLTQPTALTATTSQTNVTCNGYNNGIASVTVSGGVPAYTYSWAPSGGNAATATGLAPGTYTCTTTDANNCVIQKTFTITEPAPLSSGISFTDVTCHGAGNGTATVTPTGGTPAYTYSWAPAGGNGASATNLLAGTYTCTITDAHGCSITKTTTITEPAANLTITPSQSNITCNGASTGIASAIVSGGTLPYAYAWTPTGGNTATAYNLAAGSYTCTVTDAHNCTQTQAYTITEAPAIVAAISQADILCHGDHNGIATVLTTGGTPPYSYSWAPTGGNGPNATGLTGGVYTCTITDHNNCPHTEVITIAEPTALTIKDSQTNVVCYGETNGYASVTVSGGTAPYTYTWAPSGGNANEATNLSAGIYTCSVKDYNNCIITDSVNVTQPEKLGARTAKTNVVCQGMLNSGVAIAVGTGGTGPYTYLWSPGNTIDTIVTGLSIGKDTCLITDAHGCTYNAIFNIVDTSQPFNYTITDSATDCRSAWLNALPDAGSGEAQSFTWIFNDTIIQTGNPIVHSFLQGGPDTASLVIVNAVGCHDTLVHPMDINKPMIADYSFTPDPPLANSPIRFHNESSAYATIFNWSFGDGHQSTMENPENLYADSGLFHVCLIASDTNDCIDTICKDIKTDADKVVAVPSAFSPNGDGQNDVLYIRGFRLATVKLRIYNRWGNLVFETDTKEKGWDGTYKGQQQAEEVYAYILEATFLDGSTVQKNGSISLLR